MRDVGILAFLPDLFDLDRAAFAYKRDLTADAQVIAAADLAAIDRPTVVVDAAKLVAELRRSNHTPPRLAPGFFRRAEADQRCLENRRRRAPERRLATCHGARQSALFSSGRALAQAVV